jgi:hypothetical protein
MSSSLSIQSLRAMTNLAAGAREADPLLLRLGRRLVAARRQRADRRMAMTLEQLGHSELIADFHRASRG